MSTLAGRRAVITGGAAGIGAAIARSFAAEGAEVVIADRDGAAAEALASELGGEAWEVDFLDTAALESLELRADILVNNAGIQRVAPIDEFEPEMWRRIHTLMLEAPFLLIRAAMPHMIERGWGRILNISSVHGLIASPYKSAYVSAKHGLEGLSKVAALEGAAHGVTSNCINPGWVKTALVEAQIADQAKANGIPESEVIEKIMLTEPAIKRLLEPEEIGGLAAFLVGPHSSMATGASYVMDGGWTTR